MQWSLVNFSKYTGLVAKLLQLKSSEVSPPPLPPPPPFSMRMWTQPASLTFPAEKGSFAESTARPCVCWPFMGPDKPTPNGCHSHDTFVFIGQSTNTSPTEHTRAQLAAELDPHLLHSAFTRPAEHFI